MDDPGTSENVCRVTILDVLEEDSCRRAILNLVHIRDILHSQRVSRRWQQAVLGYLKHHRRSVALYYSRRIWSLSNIVRFDGLDHRRIMIPRSGGNITFFLTLQKCGWLISHLVSLVFNIEVLERVASYCPQLRDLDLVTSIGNCLTPESERELGKAFAAHNLERIRITHGDEMTGEFFNFIKNDLKSLQLYHCQSLNYNILSQAACLRNITELRLHYNHHPPTKRLLKALIFLNQLPKLENLYLGQGVIEEDEASVGLTDCFRRLVNLKTLIIYRIGVNDAMLKALAENCKKLEVLQIEFLGPITFWRGLVALAISKFPGHTCFCTSKYVSEEDLEHFNEKLYANGCGKGKFDIVEVCRQLRPLQLGLVAHPEDSQASKLYELKIYLDEY